MIEVGSREWIRATLALSLGSFLVFLNLYQTHPLLPLLAEVFSVSSLSAGWTLAGCTAGLAASLLVCARLADRFGRRRIMLWSLAGAILLSLLISLVSQFEQLLLLRILQGVLLAGLPATAIAYMGEEFSKRALLSAVGVYIAANSLGASPAGWSAVCWPAGLATGSTLFSASASSAWHCCPLSSGCCRPRPVSCPSSPSPASFARPSPATSAIRCWWGPTSSVASTSWCF